MTKERRTVNKNWPITSPPRFAYRYARSANPSAMNIATSVPSVSPPARPISCPKRSPLPNPRSHAPSPCLRSESSAPFHATARPKKEPETPNLDDSRFTWSRIEAYCGAYLMSLADSLSQGRGGKRSRLGGFLPLHLLKQLPTHELHPRQMKRPLPQIPLQARTDPPVPV